jgi:hypothetical protein
LPISSSRVRRRAFRDRENRVPTLSTPMITSEMIQAAVSSFGSAGTTLIAWSTRTTGTPPAHTAAEIRSHFTRRDHDIGAMLLVGERNPRIRARAMLGTRRVGAHTLHTRGRWNEKREPARVGETPVFTGMWRVRDSNPRSITRLIYSQIPLAARVTRHARPAHVITDRKRFGNITRSCGRRVPPGAHRKSAELVTRHSVSNGRSTARPAKGLAGVRADSRVPPRDRLVMHRDARIARRPASAPQCPATSRL